jgi:hypothetical protein
MRRPRAGESSFGTMTTLILKRHDRKEALVAATVF